jgi:amino acid transporter
MASFVDYGMVVAMCKEVQNPERAVLKAIALSVATAGVTDIIYLVPILFILLDVQELLSVASGESIATVFKNVTASSGGAFALLFLLLGILFLAGIGL